MQETKRIIISRADSIGDVVLSLPMARYIRQHIPGAYIGFLGKAYTRAVIEACPDVDAFMDMEDFLVNGLMPDGKGADAIIHVFPMIEIAKRAAHLKIPLRIGTTNRFYHWATCNKLIRLSRKNSSLHEAQLNLVLLRGLGIEAHPGLSELNQHTWLQPTTALKPEISALLAPGKYRVIIHPKSQGSAREWGLKHVVSLIKLLDPEQFQIFISGTAAERIQLDPLFKEAGHLVTDITGLMDLSEFIRFIHACDALVANSTGPLHIAAALGKKAVGIYPPIRPMHPGRWAPLGPQAQYFVLDRDCNDCRKKPESCHCIKSILPAEIAAVLQEAAIMK